MLVVEGPVPKLGNSNAPKPEKRLSNTPCSYAKQATKPISEIISKAKSRTGKKISIVVLDEDYLRIGKFKEKEGSDSIEDATYDLTKQGLSASGY